MAEESRICPPCPAGLDPRRPGRHLSEVVSVLRLGGAGVQTHPDREPVDRLFPPFGADGALRIDRGGDGLGGVREDRHQAVAQPLQDDTPVRGDRLCQELVAGVSRC